MNTQPDEAPVDWSALAVLDVQAIAEQINDNHPGLVDDENRGFVDLVGQGKRSALAAAAQVSGEADYQRVLERYLNEFQDVHVSVSFKHYPEWRTPGFYLSYQNQKFIVQGLQADEEDGLQGAELLACDGQSADALYEQRVAVYDGIHGLEASKAYGVWRLLLDDGSQFQSRLNHCRFQQADRVIATDLHWQVPAKQPKPSVHKENTLENSSALLSYRFLPNRAVWISLPTFSIYDGKAEDDAIHFLNELWRERKKLRAAPYVVLDLRGNSGGTNRWGRLVATSLWGGSLVSESLPALGTSYYRASTGNVNYLERLRVAYQLNNDDVVTLIAAMKRGDHSLVHIPNDEEKVKAPLDVSSRMQGKVYVLTDHACVSACLQFMDILLQMDNLVHIGLPTLGDTFYTDVRYINLPSGKAGIWLPISVIRQRARAVNVPYLPRYRWAGDIQDTKALEAWVESLQ